MISPLTGRNRTRRLMAACGTGQHRLALTAGVRKPRQEFSMSHTGSATTSRALVLAAMIFAVAMTFIDQTIVSVAAPKIQSELSLSATGVQWAINAYLLALAALFAFGGRLADMAGHRRMVVI